jgi:hypothetical protein
VSYSLARGTWKRYASALNLWKNFAYRKNLDWKSFPENETINFICWCAKRGNLKGKTVKTYLGILRSLERIRKELAEGRGETVENFIIRGIGNSGARAGSSSKKIFAPVDLKILSLIRVGLKKLGIKKLSRHCVWTACLVAFWGAFRLGELFAKKKNKFDRFSNLLWSDLRATKANRGVIVRVKSAKVPGPPGERAELYPVEGVFCPVNALKKLKFLQKVSGIWKDDLPVFRRASGKNLTRGSFLKTVNQALFAVGKGELNLGGKSFRSGILSALKSLPQEFQEKHLKSFGRWKGSSYKFYMWGGPINFSKIFDLVAKRLITDSKLPQET